LRVEEIENFISELIRRSTKLKGKVYCNKKCKDLNIKYEFPSESQVQKSLSLLKQLETNKSYAELVKAYHNIVLYYHSKNDIMYKSYLEKMREAIKKRDAALEAEPDKNQQPVNI